MSGMPFGLIFAAFFYGALCLWLGRNFLLVPWGPARAFGVMLWLLGVSMVLGLLQRRPWARWAGAALAAPLAVIGLTFVIQRGGIFDNLFFLAALATAMLLLVPATGDVRRGLPAGEAPAVRSSGRLAGLLLSATVVGFVATAVWAWSAPRPASLGAHKPRWEPSAVAWNDFGPGIQKAKSEGKPIFVDFYADWCQPCHRMDRVTFRDPEVARLLNEEIVAVRIDSEETTERHGYTGYDLAERYNILSYPTVALLDASGKVIARRTGYLGPRELLEWIEESLELAETEGDKRFV